MKQKYFFLLIMGFLPLRALKIDRVILATDNNPAYIEFWPVVAKAWKERIGVQPTLALIASNDVQVDESLGDIMRFEPLPGIPTSLQAQTIRLLLPAYFPDEVCILSDIDMIPLSKEYFVDSIAQLPDDAFVVYRQVADIPKFPMCYVAAKGSIFKEVFQIKDVAAITDIITYWHSLNIGWNTDEMVLYHYLLQWPQYGEKCIKLGHGVEKRIDRYCWAHDDQLLAQGYYIDAHCPRPYSAHKKEIDAILKKPKDQIDHDKNAIKPRVSIITSLFKGDDFIAGFLSDITRQTIFNECELIIINANSPGREEPIVKEYMKKFPNIVYKKLYRDPGLYAVWNMGIKMAHADFVTNANVDDRRNPESLEVQAYALEKNPAVDLVYGDYRVTYTPNETFELSSGALTVFPYEFSPNRMYKCLPGPQPMWRKSMHEKYGYFDESFKCGGDFEMWNRAVSKGSQFKRIALCTGVFYSNPKGLSTDTDKKSIQDAELQKIVNQYQDMWCTHHQYYCTAADKDYYKILLNLIGSIHTHNFDKLGGIAVFDIGLTEDQIKMLNAIEKVTVNKIEMVHPDLLKYFKTTHAGRFTPGWYAWKFVVLKQALELFPYVLWVDAGTTALKPLDDLFNYIDQTGYFLCNMGDKVDNVLTHDIRWGATQYVKHAFNLNAPEKAYVLDQEPLESGIIGVSRKALEYMVMPLYEYSKNLRLFEDDGTCPKGFGFGRHDQTVLSIFAYLHGLTIYEQDHRQKNPMYLNVDTQNKEFFITWDGTYVNEKTCLYHSRGDLSNYDRHYNAIRWKK